MVPALEPAHKVSDGARACLRQISRVGCRIRSAQARENLRCDVDASHALGDQELRSAKLPFGAARAIVRAGAARSAYPEPMSRKRVRAGVTNAWFHTLVVVGASLSGCSGQVESKPSPSSGGAAGGEGAAGSTTQESGAGPGNHLPRPSDCAADPQFRCTDYDALTGCECDLNAPLAAADCASPFAFRCLRYAPRSLSSPPPNPRLIDPLEHLIACECDETAPAPDDCANPTQLLCEETPVGFMNCACDPTLAVSPDECTKNEIWSCQSEDPLFGCRCTCCRIK
jgi:hypothetical protein